MNLIVIDEGGGIYVFLNRRFYKLVWDGEIFYFRGYGVWLLEYDFFIGKFGGVSFGNGLGFMFLFMGFGDEEDKFVVIMDGELIMNVVVFWCDDILEDFVQKLGIKLC